MLSVTSLFETSGHQVPPQIPIGKHNHIPDSDFNNMLSIIETFLQAPIGNTTLILTNYNVIQKSKNNQFRKNIRIGQKVKIVEKQNQGTDNYTFGVIKRIL